VIQEIGSSIIKIQDNSNRTPLHVAVGGCHIKAVEKLLQIGANVNAQDNEGNTPLAYACELGMCMLLYQPSSGIGGVESVKNRLVKLLIDKGADISISNHKGITPNVTIKERQKRTASPVTTATAATTTITESMQVESQPSEAFHDDDDDDETNGISTPRLRQSYAKVSILFVLNVTVTSAKRRIHRRLLMHGKSKLK